MSISLWKGAEPVPLIKEDAKFISKIPEDKLNVFYDCLIKKSAIYRDHIYQVIFKIKWYNKFKLSMFLDLIISSSVKQGHNLLCGSKLER